MFYIIRYFVSDEEESHFEVLYREVRNSVKDKRKQAGPTEDIGLSKDNISQPSVAMSQVPLCTDFPSINIWNLFMNLKRWLRLIEYGCVFGNVVFPIYCKVCLLSCLLTYFFL